MITVRTRTSTDMGKVIRKARQESFKNLGHAGAALRKAASRKIKKAPMRVVRGADGKPVKDDSGKSVKEARPSSPGSPPHYTRKGPNLKRAILFKVQRQQERVLIGPAFSMVGASASAHEHGGRFGDETFPQRSFMGPTLQEEMPRIPAMWRGVVQR